MIIFTHGEVVSVKCSISLQQLFPQDGVDFDLAIALSEVEQGL